MTDDDTDYIDATHTCAWKDAIIDACVVDWILTKEHETQPRLAVNDLLAWQQQIVLDPTVSKEAAELHERIRWQAEQIANAEKLIRENLQVIEELRAKVEELHEDLGNADDATVAAQQRNVALREQVLALGGKVQYLINWLDACGELPEHSFTFADGDTWQPMPKSHHNR